MSDLISNIIENFANFETSGESLPKRSHLLLKFIGCLSLLISVVLWSKNSIYLVWIPCKQQTKYYNPCLYGAVSVSVLATSDCRLQHVASDASCIK